MCPKLIELLSWNGPTVHVFCFMLARASTETFVSRVQKTAEKKLRQPKNSFAGSLVSRGITVFAWQQYAQRGLICTVLFGQADTQEAAGRLPASCQCCRYTNSQVCNLYSSQHLAPWTGIVGQLHNPVRRPFYGHLPTRNCSNLTCRCESPYPDSRAPAV